MADKGERVIRWGIIGAGNVCEHKSGPPLYCLEDSALSMVYRRDTDAAASFVQRHGQGKVAQSIEALVSSPEVDAVYVATPHHLHCEHTLAALGAGKPVMVEKPMATSTEDCDRMVEAAQQAGQTLAVAYYRRGYPAVQRLRQLILEEETGPVERVAFNNEFPTSHRLDLVHFLFGDIEEARLLPGNNDAYSFESTIDRFEVRTRTGVTVCMMTGWTESGMPESIQVNGRDGRLLLSDLKGGHLILQKNQSTQLIECGTLPYTHWGLFDNFNQHLRHGTPLLCDGVEGRKSTIILDCLQEITTPGEWVRV